MSNPDTYPTPEDLDALLAKAHAMRAEAIRTSFADFWQALRALGGQFKVPRTEQL